MGSFACCDTSSQAWWNDEKSECFVVISKRWFQVTCVTGNSSFDLWNASFLMTSFRSRISLAEIKFVEGNSAKNFPNFENIDHCENGNVCCLFNAGKWSQYYISWFKHQNITYFKPKSCNHAFVTGLINMSILQTFEISNKKKRTKAKRTKQRDYVKRANFHLARNNKERVWKYLKRYCPRGGRSSLGNRLGSNLEACQVAGLERMISLSACTASAGVLLADCRCRQSWVVFWGPVDVLFNTAYQCNWIALITKKDCMIITIYTKMVINVNVTCCPFVKLEGNKWVGTKILKVFKKV